VSGRAIIYRKKQQKVRLRNQSAPAGLLCPVKGDGPAPLVDTLLVAPEGH
jgi:hypothetical protein